MSMNFEFLKNFIKKNCNAKALTNKQKKLRIAMICARNHVQEGCSLTVTAPSYHF